MPVPTDYSQLGLRTKATASKNLYPTVFERELKTLRKCIKDCVESYHWTLARESTEEESLSSNIERLLLDLAGTTEDDDTDISTKKAEIVTSLSAMSSSRDVNPAQVEPWRRSMVTRTLYEGKNEKRNSTLCALEGLERSIKQYLHPTSRVDELTRLRSGITKLAKVAGEWRGEMRAHNASAEQLRVENLERSAIAQATARRLD